MSIISLFYFLATVQLGLDVTGVDSAKVEGLDHFSFSEIASPQANGAPFSVTITAKDQYGITFTGYSGEAYLTSTLGDVKPTRIFFADGTATVDVTLQSSYNMAGCRLVCSGQCRKGESNRFDVTGGQTCLGRLYGRVKDTQGTPVSGASVILYDSLGLEAGSELTNVDGNYAFWDLGVDRYTVVVSKDSRSAMDFADVRNNESNFAPIIFLNFNEITEGTPVILVNGIMGSTSEKWEMYPALPKKSPADGLHLWDFASNAGWKNLRKRLEEEGFHVIDCPWDWRQTCEEAVEHDLIPRITEATNHWSNTSGKVHIVAHSMGGLVSRAYIQRAMSFANVIDKLVMVGTPHLGSANPYYIWEVGNRKPSTICCIRFSGSSGKVFSTLTTESSGSSGAFIIPRMMTRTRARFGRLSGAKPRLFANSCTRGTF